ncbi:hypothetical protein ACFQZR_03805 [Paenibacillus sp. GCM10027629]
MEYKYNPFEDKTIHTTQPGNISDDSDRQGFNDVIKHYDAVNGFQNPKQLNQFPRSIRQIIRWAIILYVSTFFGYIIYSIIINFF